MSALSLEKVSKSYPGVRALADVDFSCHPGEIHALVGENGSGKSTLIKVASGTVAADSGTVRVGGTPLAHPSPRAARAMGVYTAYQDTSLVPGLSVADNLLLACLGTDAMPRLRSRFDPGLILAQYKLDVSPGTAVGDLSPAARQLLEVIKAVMRTPRVLLLDEPTAALDAESIEMLTGVLDSAREAGTAIVYISHRLDEVRRFADRITVIRDGVVQGTSADGGWSAGEIVSMMVGVPTSMEFPAKPLIPPDAPPALTVRGLVGDGFGPVDMNVARGEIVGVAAAEGNGQRELVRSVAGLQRSRAGTVTTSSGSRRVGSPRAAAAAGIEFQSGDRAAEAMFGALSVARNLTVSLRGELGPLGLVLPGRELALLRRMAERLGIVHAAPGQPVEELSGGNQQKVIMARSVLRPGSVIIADEPTQGVDARARLDIYAELSGHAANGTGVLLSSSDASELAGLCSRVYVMSGGKVVKQLAGAEVTESAIVDGFVNVRPHHETEGDVSPVDHASPEPDPAPGARATTAGPPGGRLLPWRLPALTAGSSLPILIILALIVIVGGYTAGRSSVFLTQFNLYSLLLGALPLAVVAVGEQFCLVTGGFDVSIGSTMSLAVVLCTAWVGQGALGAVGGIIGVVLAGLLVGACNGFVVRVLRVNAIVATIATLGIVQGIAVALHPSPSGTVSGPLTTGLGERVSFVPVAFIVILLAAIALDAWLGRSSAGLVVRAVGQAEQNARRIGARVGVTKFGGYLWCGALAAVAGLFLAVQLGVGDATSGADYALTAFAACFLGGAGMFGGKGSYAGAVCGAVFLGLLTNVEPLIGLPDGISQVFAGALTIIAVAAHSLNLSPRRSAA